MWTIQELFMDEYSPLKCFDPLPMLELKKMVLLWVADYWRCSLYHFSLQRCTINKNGNDFSALQNTWLIIITCRYEVPKVVKRTLLQRSSLIGQNWRILPSDWPCVFLLRGMTNKHSFWPIRHWVHALGCRPLIGQLKRSKPTGRILISTILGIIWPIIKQHFVIHIKHRNEIEECGPLRYHWWMTVVH